MSNYRGIFPGTFTMGNVVCGFLAILSAFEGHTTTACWFVSLADSLADFLSFGVAPAVLVYSIKLNSLGKWGWVFSVVYIMAAAYRLARFNLFATTEEKKNFMGLPVPIAALALVSFIIFSYTDIGSLS